VAYVSGRSGAIGYVSSESNTEGVKVLMVLRQGQTGERTLLTRVEPEYPETLKKLGIGGSVRLRLTISPKGAVESVAVMGGNPIFVEVAVKAVKQWVYAPSSSQTTTEVTIPFQPRP
jgi:TonB family protein